MSVQSVLETCLSAYPRPYLLIAGERIEQTDAGTLPVLNPATGAECGALPVATREHLDRAAEAACEGFAEWSSKSALERSNVMRRAAAIIRERAEALARVTTTELGKVLVQSRGEWQVTAEALEWAAEEGRRVYGRVIPSRDPAVTQFVEYYPVGPIAAFSPWNFPAWAAIQKIAPALAAGCSVVIKPAEETPVSALLIAEALLEAGLPPKAMNVVYGHPAEISDHLIRHPAIRKISFTGSVPVGRSLSALAGQYLKRATMELGGHNPVIIARDADIAHAAEAAAAAKFRNAGQVCVSPTRFLVEAPVAEEFGAAFAARAHGIVIGDPAEEGIQMGPLVNERRRLAMEAFVEDALDCGASLLAGGKRLNRDGFFFQPTVLGDVPVTARAMREEVFGPIALITPVGSIDEALEIGNSLEYGLGSYLFSSSDSVIHKVRRNLRAGMLGINHYQLALAETPFGGIKESGFGSEGGTEAIAAYLETHYITHRSI